MQTTGPIIRKQSSEPFDGGMSKPQPQPKRPAPVKTQTLTLIANNGELWDSVQIAAGRNVPQVVIWGVGSSQRVFQKDGKVFRECSWIEWAPTVARTF